MAALVRKQLGQKVPAGDVSPQVALMTSLQVPIRSKRGLETDLLRS